MKSENFVVLEEILWKKMWKFLNFAKFKILIFRTFPHFIILPYFVNFLVFGTHVKSSPNKLTSGFVTGSETICQITK